MPNLQYKLNLECYPQQVVAIHDHVKLNKMAILSNIAKSSFFYLDKSIINLTVSQFVLYRKNCNRIYFAAYCI